MFLEIFIGLLISVFIAEFVSSIAHHFEDRYGNPDWAESNNIILRFIGKNIVLPNIEHHKFPSRICNGGFWNRNWTAMVPSFILAACFWWYWPACLGFILMGFTNQFHAFSHERCSPFIRFLQKIRVLNSPKEHHKHHRSPYSIDFCVMTGLLNPVLRAINFWTFWEFLIYMITGAKPLKEREKY